MGRHHRRRDFSERWRDRDTSRSESKSFSVAQPECIAQPQPFTEPEPIAKPELQPNWDCHYDDRRRRRSI